MVLSNELIAQFVEVTNQDKQIQNGNTVYGTVKKYNGADYVQLDGSELLTPIKTTTYVSDGERVTVMIKDHQAVVTGNISSPATRQTDVEDTVGDKISEFDIVITKELEANYAKIETLKAEYATIKKLETEYANIEQLKSEYATIENLEANYATINELHTKYADIETLKATYATIENLEANYITSNYLQANYADINQLKAEYATITKLESEYAKIQDLDAKYANIDFANINMAAVEQLFAKSGIIQNLVVGDQHITGELVGVTIKGDLIEGNTIVADKLVVKGSDGLYYKLNTDGMKVEAEQTEYNSLNGSIITAKSITASKVMVDDLVAFDATIGGFKITDNSIYSGVKSSIDNTTRGIYLDNTGQVAFGNSSNFIKFFKDSDGLWKLDISASSVTLSASNKNIEDTIDEINDKVQNTIKLVETYYAMSDDYSVAPTTGWSKTSPTWVNGKYIWSKTLTTYMDGSQLETEPVCITGAKGSDAILLNVISSNGHMFKNTSVSTTLTVEIIFGDVTITSSKDMYLYFGENAKIIWQQKRRGETVYTDIDPNDPRISDNGFIFTIGTSDLKLETVYSCLLDC